MQDTLQGCSLFCNDCRSPSQLKPPCSAKQSILCCCLLLPPIFMNKSFQRCPNKYSKSLADSREGTQGLLAWIGTWNTLARHLQVINTASSNWPSPDWYLKFQVHLELTSSMPAGSMLLKLVWVCTVHADPSYVVLATAFQFVLISDVHHDHVALATSYLIYVHCFCPSHTFRCPWQSPIWLACLKFPWMMMPNFSPVFLLLSFLSWALWILGEW